MMVTNKMGIKLAIIQFELQLMLQVAGLEHQQVQH